MNLALLASVFIIASCGLVYELVAGALSSYLLGDSVTQFSTIIGTYLFAMGVGSYLSRHIVKGLVARFIQIELMVGVVGGFSAALLFLVFAWAAGPFKVVLYGLVLLTGILVGLEIPLVMRILKQHYGLKDLVSQVLTFDYLGALVVSLAFPLLLAPHLGLIRTSLMFGLLNALVAGWAVWLFRAQLAGLKGMAAQCVVVSALLVAGLAGADRLTTLAEANLYADEIIYTETTPYQRIVLTRWQDDVRLFLNGNLQFSSRDEYRYHEALIHPALQAVKQPRRVLVLGGGDGLAVREILKYPGIESITLVDLDPNMTRLFSRLPLLRELNQDALHSPKLKLVNDDAFLWLEKNGEFYDFIVVDFPDPTNFALGKLYTNTFYRLLEKRLSQHGLAVIQSTSPLYARQSFWCIVNTIRSVGLQATPYHALVPSFGEWGYVIASHQPYVQPDHYSANLRFVSSDLTPTLFQFPKDMAPMETEINRLNNQALVHYYEAEWKHQAP
ncbi:polyamine aminopropyltransferase 1 [Sulfurimicrobium lacus]|uniref:Polyamine aminopropyltransferase n=1 Tax=Sulfurimicrobium lacus TaxID=2715678 RepID=A0A6F8VE69_9PROT|nr:polyamine aminopropyltransferase [Sulfurimicrobium lacus]BCB27242.1 polyamine aminopropyltransferase 1 [Sulfurimicrobium lacus]